MIFNEELDKSLFLILKNDKKNRKDIIRLLKNIPNDFYSKMIYSLNKCDDNFKIVNNETYKKFEYTLEITDEDRIIINMEDKIIGDIIELSLSSFDLTNDKIELGYFSKIINKKKGNEVIEKKYNYNVFNLPKEPVFIRVKDSRKIISGFPIISEFKEEKIPNDLTLKYINDKFDKKNK